MLTAPESFAGDIKNEIASNQRIEALRKTSVRNLVVHLLPTILERRLLKLGEFPSAGPDAIRKIVNNIALKKGGLTAAEHKKMILKVCEVVGRGSPTMWRLTLMPTKEQTAGYPNDGGDDEALVVAIKLGDHSLINAFLNAGASP